MWCSVGYFNGLRLSCVIAKLSNPERRRGFLLGKGREAGSGAGSRPGQIRVALAQKILIANTEGLSQIGQ